MQGVGRGLQSQRLKQAAAGWHRVLQGLVLIGLGCLSAVAFAQAVQHPIELRWQAPEPCPGSADVLAEIDQLLGGRPSGERRMVVDAQIRAAAAGGWTLDVSIRDDAGEGERQLSGASCGEVASAAALIVALAFDPRAVAEAQRRAAARPAADDDQGGGGNAQHGGAAGDEPDGAPGAAPDPLLPLPAAPVMSAPSAPAPAPRIPGVADGYLAPRAVARKRLWLSAAVHAALDLGTLPKPAFGVGGALTLRRYPLVGRVRGSYFVGAEHTVASPPTAGGDFDLWAVAPGFCLTPWHGATDGRRQVGDLALDACAEIELGQMRGAGFGVDRPDEGSAAWLTPLLGGQGELTLHRWLALRVALALGMPILRPNFVLEQVGIVHTASAVIGRGVVELGVVF